MVPAIRPAISKDLPAMVALLTQDAQERRSLDPMLWRLPADAPARIEAAVSATINGSQARVPELWLVAEHADRIVGIAHAIVVPVPPIYDGSAGSPGLLLDDCFVSADAPSNTTDSLLGAAESALRSAGAARLVASCPGVGSLRAVYERRGYAPVTLYMAKHGFTRDALSPKVRPANVEDVPGIVKRSAEHWRTLAKINPRFWHIHPEADSRFDAWMRRSLTFKDRDMLVVAEAGEVHGYVIAQPIAPLLIPAVHDIAAIGVIDDFCDADFADISASSTGAPSGTDLLAAAETAFARRGTETALVVCPAAWPSKIALLEQSGYRTAKVWMLKR
jgi:hypothetical protein